MDGKLPRWLAVMVVQPYSTDGDLRLSISIYLPLSIEIWQFAARSMYVWQVSSDTDGACKRRDWTRLKRTGCGKLQRILWDIGCQSGPCSASFVVIELTSLTDVNTRPLLQMDGTCGFANKFFSVKGSDFGRWLLCCSALLLATCGS